MQVGLGRNGMEGRLPLERGRVEDVDAGAVARDGRAHIAAYYNHLAVAQVARVAGSRRRRAVLVRNPDPGEGWDREDIHVAVLDLLFLPKKTSAIVG